MCNFSGFNKQTKSIFYNVNPTKYRSLILLILIFLLVNKTNNYINLTNKNRFSLCLPGIYLKRCQECPQVFEDLIFI